MSSVEEYQPEAYNFKPGQKHATPSPGFGDRVFYETLLQQRPDSEMAQEWCLAYGILDTAQAQELYDNVLRRKGKVGSPVKKSQLAPKGRVSTSSSSAARGIAETKAHQADSDMDNKSADEEDAEDDEDEEEDEKPKGKQKAGAPPKKSATGSKKRRRSGKYDSDEEDEDEEEEFDE